MENTIRAGTNTKGKGKKGKNCNRTVCQRAKSANYYNKSTRAWYCRSCAEAINYWAKKDGGEALFDNL